MNIYEFSLISIYTNSDSKEIIISTSAPTVVKLYKKTINSKMIFLFFKQVDNNVSNKVSYIRETEHHVEYSNIIITYNIWLR